MTVTDGPGDGGTRGNGGAERAPSWWIYRGTGREPTGDRGSELLPPPPWRTFSGWPLVEPPPQDHGEETRRLGPRHTPRRPSDTSQLAVVNAALHLRRPLLVTGRPGTGKSSLAYRVARELRLGRVLRWPVTSRTTLRSGLYEYDAIGRVQAAATLRASEPDTGPGGPPGVSAHRAVPAGRGAEYQEGPPIGDFVHLGPLGTALLPYARPRVLLVDELDKSDMDLPNDLLNVFEDGMFTVPELVRVQNRTPEVVVRTDDPGRTATVRGGRVLCREFPVVVITSNGEREFPPAFLRRCLRLELPEPDAEQLADMVAAHFPDARIARTSRLIDEFMLRSAREGGLAADQLLNAVHLVTSGTFDPEDGAWEKLLDALWRRLSDPS